MFSKSEFYNSALDKAKVAFGVKSDNELSKVLGIGRSSISHARTHGTLPAKPLIDACVEKKVSLDWIFGIKKSNVARD